MAEIFLSFSLAFFLGLYLFLKCKICQFDKDFKLLSLRGKQYQMCVISHWHRGFLDKNTQSSVETWHTNVIVVILHDLHRYGHSILFC